MIYKDFGKTGMKISAMTLGAWGMGGGGAWDNYEEEVRVDALAAAVDAGINMVDTAACYNGGESERFLGRTIKRLGLRDKLFITTKTGNRYVDGKTYIRDGKYNSIIEMTDESLQNLQMDYVDLMLIHWPDKTTSFEETMDALNRLKKEGKILHIGVSNFTIDELEDIMRYGEIEAYEPPFSMVDRSQLDRIQFAHEAGMAVMTYGSLGGGILTGAFRELPELSATDSRNRFYKNFHEPRFSQIMELLSVMDGVAARTGMALSQIALNWSLAKPYITTCIVGAQTRAKVLQNAGAFDAVLPAEEIALLDEAVEKIQGKGSL